MASKKSKAALAYGASPARCQIFGLALLTAILGTPLGGRPWRPDDSLHCHQNWHATGSNSITPTPSIRELFCLKITVFARPTVSGRHSSPPLLMMAGTGRCRRGLVPLKVAENAIRGNVCAPDYLEIKSFGVKGKTFIVRDRTLTATESCAWVKG